MTAALMTPAGKRSQACIAAAGAVLALITACTSSGTDGAAAHPGASSAVSATVGDPTSTGGPTTTDDPVNAGTSAGGGSVGAMDSSSSGAVSPASTAAAGSDAPGGAEMLIPDLVAGVAPSIVTSSGSGSGVVYTTDGLLITNEHVVRGETRVQVAFADGQRVAGNVQAVDPISDIALVQASRTNLPVAQFEQALPRVGELAIVIGSPLGYENSATAGIISGLHRSIPGSAGDSQSLVDLIQTDAAISPGNSGGALMNSAGRVIGISEAYIPPQSGAVSLGFAIPAATALQTADQLRASGRAEHAFLGLVPVTITPQIAQQLGLTAGSGVIVQSTVPDGPADTAGIVPGDVLTMIDDEELTTAEDLLAALRPHRPGDILTIGLQRDGRTVDTKVTVSDRPTG